MSWKTSTIVIRPAFFDADHEGLLEHLGYERRYKINQGPFEGGCSIWIGAILDRIIIHTHLADQFFDGFIDGPLDEDFVFLKRTLLQQFHDSEIAVFWMDGRVDSWAFAVFRGGNLIRRFYGYDGVITGNEGPPLPAENDYLANCERTEVDGEVFYKSASDASHGNEAAPLPCHGTEILLEVWRSFIGLEFDSREFQKISGTSFWLNDDEAKSIQQMEAIEKYIRTQAAQRRSKLPWWKKLLHW